MEFIATSQILYVKTMLRFGNAITQYTRCVLKRNRNVLIIILLQIKIQNYSMSPSN